MSLVLVVLLANLPFLGRSELDHEEARRALPAAAMLEGASAVVPSIWGRPYWAKPPLFYWAVAASGAGLTALGLDGAEAHLARAEPLRLEPASVDLAPAAPALALEAPRPISPLAVRLPSVLAAVATVLTAFALVRPRATRGAAAVAAGSIALAPNFLSKSALGEIELTLVALSFAGTAVAWVGLRRNLLALIGGALIGAAVLAKGPVALAFGLLPLWLAALGLAGRADLPARATALGRAFLATLPALALPGLWLLLLDRERASMGALADTWSSELGRGGPGSLAVYLGDRGKLVLGLLGGWLPASVLALVGWRAWTRSPLGRFACLALGCGLVLMAVWPGVRTRYALPLLPWAAVLAGLAVAAEGHAVAVTARGLARVGIAAGATVALGVPLLALLGGLADGDEPIEPTPLVIAVGVALLVAASVALWRWRRAFRALPPARALALAGLALLGARVAERSLLEPRTAHEHLRAASAAELVSGLSRAGLLEAPLTIATWKHFNLLYYTGLPWRWVDDPSAVPVGGLLLLDASDAPDPVDGVPWESVLDHGSDTGARLLGREVRLPRRCELRSISLWLRGA